MSVLVDASVIIAFLHRRDRMHAKAVRLLQPVLEGAHGPPAITDYLVDEVLTFLVARGASRAQLNRSISFLLGDGTASGPFVLHRVEPDHFAQALRLLMRHRERRMSFTDCTCLAMMASKGIGAIASFDQGFDGLVVRLGSQAP